jgi:hypothetical protein
MMMGVMVLHSCKALLREREDRVVLENFQKKQKEFSQKFLVKHS